MAEHEEASNGGRPATQKWTEEMEQAYEAAVAEVGGLEEAKPRAILDLLLPQFPELTLQRVKWHLLAHRRRAERHRAMQPAGIAPPTKWVGRLEEAYQEAVARLGGLQTATPKPLLEALQGEFPDLTLQVVKCHLQKQRRKQQEQQAAGGGARSSNASEGGGAGATPRRRQQPQPQPVQQQQAPQQQQQQALQQQQQQQQQQQLSSSSREQQLQQAPSIKQESLELERQRSTDSTHLIHRQQLYQQQQQQQSYQQQQQQQQQGQPYQQSYAQQQGWQSYQQHQSYEQQQQAYQQHPGHAYPQQQQPQQPQGQPQARRQQQELEQAVHRQAHPGGLVPPHPSHSPQLPPQHRQNPHQQLHQVQPNSQHAPALMHPHLVDSNLLTWQLQQWPQTWSAQPPPWQRFLLRAAREELVKATRETLHCRQTVLILEQRADQLVRLTEELAHVLAEEEMRVKGGAMGGGMYGYGPAGVNGMGMAQGMGRLQLNPMLQRQLLQLVPGSSSCLGLPLGGVNGEGGAHRVPRYGSTRQQRTQAEIAATFTLLQPRNAGALSPLTSQAGLAGAGGGAGTAGPGVPHRSETCAVPQCQVCAYERRLLQVRRE